MMRVPPVTAVEGHAVGGDVAAGPTRGDAAQVGVEQEVGIRAAGKTDRQALHRGVLGGERGADAGALEREILLQQALIDLGFGRGGAERQDRDGRKGGDGRADSRAVDSVGVHVERDRLNRIGKSCGRCPIQDA